MKSPRPYVAVTGITSTAEIAHLDLLRDRLPPLSRRVVAGILVSAKTLRGEPTPNRRYPDIDVVWSLCVDALVKRWIPAIHYNTRANGDDLARELDALHEAAPHMRMLQLNVVSPDPRVVKAWRARHPDVEIILQLNDGTRREALARATRLDASCNLFFVTKFWHEAVDHVLIDGSRGEGRAFDVRTVGSEIACSAPDLYHHAKVRVGVAGGLGPDSHETLGALRSSLGDHLFAPLSFDAETGLRSLVDDPTPGEKGQDALDLRKVEAFLRLFSDAGQEVT